MRVKAIEAGLLELARLTGHAGRVALDMQKADEKPAEPKTKKKGE